MSFDPFNDFATAGYLQNTLKLKDPKEVKESEHLSFELSVEDALAFLASQDQISYATVLKVHEILFSDFYPWAGKDRNQLTPHLAVFKGSRDDPYFTVFEYPHSIQLAVDYALKMALNVERFCKQPGAVLGQLAFAHPFLDGNGRTLLLVFMELSYRAGFSIDCSRTTKDGYLAALSDEIREPSKGHLDSYLQPYIINIDHRDQWPTIIGGIKGLDGLDKEAICYGSLDDPLIHKNYKGYQSQPLDE